MGSHLKAFFLCVVYLGFCIFRVFLTGVVEKRERERERE
jgi:hypothetical protein